MRPPSRRHQTPAGSRRPSRRQCPWRRQTEGVDTCRETGSLPVTRLRDRARKCARRRAPHAGTLPSCRDHPRRRHRPSPRSSTPPEMSRLWYRRRPARGDQRLHLAWRHRRNGTHQPAAACLCTSRSTGSPGVAAPARQVATFTRTSPRGPSDDPEARSGSLRDGRSDSSLKSWELWQLNEHFQH